MNLCYHVEGWREGMVREFGTNMYTLIHLKPVTNKVLLCSTGDSVQCYVAAWMGGEFGGEWYMYMCGWVPSCSPETITTVLIIYTPIWASLVAQQQRIHLPMPANAGDVSSTPELRRTSGEGNGNPLQYCCLENSMYRGALPATVHGIAKGSNMI